jgi:tripartite-type tricarboxylate transporter receptor subunit TctC
MGKKMHLKVISVLLTYVLVMGVLSACSSSSSGNASYSGESSSTNTEQKTSVDFPKREITLIVPYSAGGGFDTAARMIAPYWEKYLPNNVSVIVENKPGGKGNIALGELTKADPDGYTVGLVNLPGHFVNQIMGEAAYDLKEFEYIGNITKTIYAAAASKESGFTKLEDLQNADEVIAGITNISSTDGLGVVLSAEALGINVRTINHKGSTEAILSATRGDVNWGQFPYESLRSSFDSGELVPLWVYSDERLPELPDTPTIKELGYENLLDSIALYRVIATSPGTPDDVLTILRESFQQAVNDEEYKQKVADSGAQWNPGDYELVEKVVEDSLNMLEPHKDLIKENR